ncbi:MAG: DUF3791 domain-containing protein [Prevotellaceae bacterium]|jgi:hypothetical protein|nr:DUF3791 domain-containing protein [Prevotellaceae bacterium]
MSAVLDLDLDKDTMDEISFISFIIPEFSYSYNIPVQEAYLYLKKYGGLDYLYKHWWTLHTEDPYWAIKSLYSACCKNGGLR